MSIERAVMVMGGIMVMLTVALGLRPPPPLLALLVSLHRL